MPIDRTRLPHGVTVPARLADDDARDLVKTLADAYGWTYLILDRDTVEHHLTDNQGATGAPWRQLAADEWQRIRDTTAWDNMPTTIRNAVTDTDAVRAAIRQAALECVACATPLTGPPTATWGHCPACLLLTDLATLRRRHCPAANADGPHRWGRAACHDCGLPRTDAATMPRRLAAA